MILIQVAIVLRAVIELRAAAAMSFLLVVVRWRALVVRGAVGGGLVVMRTAVGAGRVSVPGVLEGNDLGTSECEDHEESERVLHHKMQNEFEYASFFESTHTAVSHSDSVARVR